jgi:hypothetical protein
MILGSLLPMRQKRRVVSSGGGGGGGGTGLTSFTLKSAATSGQQPFSIAFGLKEGDATTVSTDLPGNAYQAKIISTWPGGSAKHVIVSGQWSATQNATLTVNVNNGTPPSGTALAHADIVAAAPTSVVDCAAFGSASLATRLAAGAPDVVLVAGPQMIEAWYRADVGSDIHVTWYVKLWAEGRKHVGVMVENGFLDDGAGAVWTNTTRSYTPTITIGGVTVFNSAVTHYGHTGYYAEGWIGGDPQLTKLHEVVYQRETKLFPNGGHGAATEATIAALDQTYVQMNNGPIKADMGGTGDTPGIGLIPHWDMCYLTTGDSRAFTAMVVGSLSINAFPVCFRTKAAKQTPPKITGTGHFGTWTVDGPGAGGVTAVGAGTNSWDHAHHPQTGYTAFMLTGDGVHLENCAKTAGMCFLVEDSSNGTGTDRIIGDQLRGVAWMLRSAGLYASVCPDSMKGTNTPGTDFGTWVNSNYTSFKTVSESGASKAWSGNLYDVNNYGAWTGTGSIPPWQVDFWISVNGWLSELKFLSDMSTIVTVRDWMYRFIVGRLGAAGRSSEYPFYRAAQYGIKAATDNTGATWYQSWGEIYNQSFGGLNTTVSNTLIEGNIASSNGGADSYWGNLVPAIAYAVDHQAPGARAAWTRLTGATNWSTVATGLTQYLSFAVAPRNARVSLYTVPANESILIGTNTMRAVKPSGMTDGTFDNSTFGSYSGGTYVPWYGRAGAYVMGPTGGHNNEYLYDSAIFPLDGAVSTAATWVAKVNANGVDAATNSAPTANEIADSNGSPYYEKSNATSGQMPVLGHTYGSIIALQEGNQGSLLWCTRGATCNESFGVSTMHKQDLETALWTRFITGTAGDNAQVEGWAVHDRNTNRVYFGHDSFWGRNVVHYAHAGTKTYSSVTFGFPAGPASGAYIKAFPFTKRRLILWHDTLGNVWEWDTLNPTTPPAFISSTGSFAVNDGQARFEWDEDNGFFVQKPGWTGDVVNTLTPPNDRSLGTGGQYTKGSRTIGGSGLPDGVKGPAVPVPQYSQHAYSEELGLHLWVSDSTTQVALFKLA